MRKRILFLAAVQTLTLAIPMATHAYAHENQLTRAQPAADAPIFVEPSLPWPARGLLPV